MLNQRLHTGMVLALLLAPASAIAGEDAQPTAVDDCPAGATAREVYASENSRGMAIAMRLHFCIKDPQDGIRQLSIARRDVANDTALSPTMRASLIKQLDAELARLGSGK